MALTAEQKVQVEGALKRLLQRAQGTTATPITDLLLQARADTLTAVRADLTAERDRLDAKIAGIAAEQGTRIAESQALRDLVDGALTELPA